MRRAFEEPGRWRSANTAENEENVASHAATVFVFPSDPAGPFHPPPWRAARTRMQPSVHKPLVAERRDVSDHRLPRPAPRRVTGEPREGEVKGQRVAR